jgi:hypothetical protein
MNRKDDTAMTDDLDTKLRAIIAQCRGYTTDDVVAQIKAVFESEGYSKHDWSIRPGSVEIDGVPHMSGQEWFDKFKAELETKFPLRAKEYFIAIEAARVAAGLPTEGEL